VTGTPVVDASSVTFELVDRRGRLAAVRLAQEIGLPEPLDFARTQSAWRLVLPQPDVDRMEYLFEVADHNGNRTTILDPANPRHAPGAFGEKSVAEFPGYRPPEWLTVEPVPATQTTLSVEAPALAGELHLMLWAPDALDELAPAPLLVVHDGPEYASLGGFTAYLAASVAIGALPPLRAALLDPGDRNDWYSANRAYAGTLGAVVRDMVRHALPVTTTIGVGASLGALAILHAHCTQAGLFDGLLLQSGSFFTPELDPQEARFSGFPAVTEFVQAMLTALADPHPVPAVLTCGTVEENLANNREMATALRRLGYPTVEVICRDAHNFTAWRDALDPHLTELVSTVVAARAA
jgi:enterochelin esterase-like enzyme